jgi:hypothetical protein
VNLRDPNVLRRPEVKDLCDIPVLLALSKACCCDRAPPQQTGAYLFFQVDLEPNTHMVPYASPSFWLNQLVTRPITACDMLEETAENLSEHLGKRSGLSRSRE